MHISKGKTLFLICLYSTEHNTQSVCTPHNTTLTHTPQSVCTPPLVVFELESKFKYDFNTFIHRIFMMNNRKVPMKLFQKRGYSYMDFAQNSCKLHTPYLLLCPRGSNNALARKKTNFLAWFHQNETFKFEWAMYSQCVDVPLCSNNKRQNVDNPRGLHNWYFTWK